MWGPPGVGIEVIEVADEVDDKDAEFGSDAEAAAADVEANEEPALGS